MAQATLIFILFLLMEVEAVVQIFHLLIMMELEAWVGAVAAVVIQV